MGLKDFVDRYIISLPATRPTEPPPEEIDPAAVPIEATRRFADIRPQVDEKALRAVPQDAAAQAGDFPIEKVFEAARIPKPPQGFSIEKVGEMLANPKLAGLAPEARAAAVLVALEASGAALQGVIEDAVHKDRALDVFEKVQREHVESFRTQKEEENRKLLETVEKNKRSVEERQLRLDAWLEKKAKKELELHAAVGHFTSQNPITAPRPAQPAPPPPASSPEPPPRPGTVKITDLTQPS
ncbi:MAG TPA: hypothetical protein DCM05_14430 [Elusimicrobia bacterium]|nr:hypothetical protein [Elusimicrobiota bacterium]